MAAWHLASKTPFPLFLGVFNGCEMYVHPVERLKMDPVLVFRFILDSSIAACERRSRRGPRGGHGVDHGEVWTPSAYRDVGLDVCRCMSASQSVKSQESRVKRRVEWPPGGFPPPSTEHRTRGTGHGTSNKGATHTQRTSGPRYRNLRLVAGQVREVRMWPSEIRWKVDCGKWRE